MLTRKKRHSIKSESPNHEYLHQMLMAFQPMFVSLDQRGGTTVISIGKARWLKMEMRPWINKHFPIFPVLE